jgi:hypothetical protein
MQACFSFVAGAGITIRRAGTVCRLRTATGWHATTPEAAFVLIAGIKRICEILFLNYLMQWLVYGFEP